MSFYSTQAWLAVGLAFLACLSTESWAIKRGKIANGPAYSAVIKIDHCSAVVIHPRAFLTAAHCASPIQKGRTAVVYSSSSLSDDVIVQSVYLNEGYVNKGWHEFKVNDDIALIVLKDPIDDAGVLANIPKMIDESALNPNETLMAVGFGVYDLGTASPSGSNENLDRRKAFYRLQEKKLSVDFLKVVTPGVGICDGDSGGGLLRVSADGKTSELVGIITAFGSICGGRDQNDYAESVSSHLDWIKQNLRKEGIALE